MEHHKVVATTSEEKDEILDQLIKLRHEFEKLNGVSVSIPSEPKDVTLFGLTLDEAKDWIQGEPDFKRDVTKSKQNLILDTPRNWSAALMLMQILRDGCQLT